MNNDVSTNRGSQEVEKNIQKNKQPSVYEIVQYEGKTFIQQMAYMLIRPPRFRYNKFLINPNKKVENFVLQNHQLQEFQLSLYLPVNTKPDYIILYLHGNSSSRLEGFLYLNMLPQNVGMACFDFLGCGNRFSSSDNNKIDFITCGKNQSKQVDIAAKYLKSLGYKVVGWGRSMGSVSLLLSSQIQIMIVDSPYQSLNQLCLQSEQKVIPCYLKCFALCFFNCIFDKIKSKVLQLSGLKLQEMEIVDKINYDSQKRQICFIHGQQDNLISYSHSESLYQKFQGRKQLILFQGTHNSNRDQDVIDACIQFIQESFQMIEMKRSEKKSKLNFVRQKQDKKLSEKKLLSFNSLKKSKKKIIMQKIPNQKMPKRKITFNSQEKVIQPQIKNTKENQTIGIQLIAYNQTPNIIKQSITVQNQCCWKGIEQKSKQIAKSYSQGSETQKQ